jgi:hypothetical protein
MKFISKWVYSYNSIDCIVNISYDTVNRDYVASNHRREILRRKTLGEIEQPLTRLEYQKEN